MATNTCICMYYLEKKPVTHLQDAMEYQVFGKRQLRMVPECNCQDRYMTFIIFKRSNRFKDQYNRYTII